jgi:hypothetical protein
MFLNMLTNYLPETGLGKSEGSIKCDFISSRIAPDAAHSGSEACRCGA